MSDSIDIINAFALLTNFVILPALSYGSQLALGALAVTLVYSILRFSNFAQGDSMAFGTMLVILISGYMISKGWTITGFPTAILAIPLALIGMSIYLLSNGSDWSTDIIEKLKQSRILLVLLLQLVSCLSLEVL